MPRDDTGAGLAPGRLQLPAMLVLVAPDCYGDTLSAVEASAAIATGWTRSRPGDRFIVAPQSDGGPGFVEVLAGRLGVSPSRVHQLIQEAKANPAKEAGRKRRHSGRQEGSA